MNDVYFSLVLSYITVKEGATEWHPTTPFGPFARLTRGAFASEAEAHDWAEAHFIPRGSYEVRAYGA